jgi:hypothetical protein
LKEICLPSLSANAKINDYFKNVKLHLSQNRKNNRTNNLLYSLGMVGQFPSLEAPMAHISSKPLPILENRKECQYFLEKEKGAFTLKRGKFKYKDVKILRVFCIKKAVLTRNIGTIVFCLIFAG